MYQQSMNHISLNKKRADQYRWVCIGNVLANPNPHHAAGYDDQEMGLLSYLLYPYDR